MKVVFGSLWSGRVPLTSSWVLEGHLDAGHSPGRNSKRRGPEAYFTVFLHIFLIKEHFVLYDINMLLTDPLLVLLQGCEEVNL